MLQLLKPWPFGNCFPFFYQVWPAKKTHAPKIISDASCIQLPISSGVSACKTAERNTLSYFLQVHRKTSLWSIQKDAVLHIYLSENSIFSTRCLPHRKILDIRSVYSNVVDHEAGISHHSFNIFQADTSTKPV